MPQQPVAAAGSPATDLAALEDQITELAAHLNAATYRLLALIREFDQRGGWNGVGVTSCAHWLNWKCGIALGAAREKVRVAHALADLPQISAALRCGQISFSKVRAMTRVATPQNESYLLMIAAHGTAAHVERLVRNYRTVKRNEALALDNQHHAQRECRWYIDDDGSFVLKARLSPEQGARVAQALDAALGAMYEEQRDAVEDVSAGTSMTAAARNTVGNASERTSVTAARRDFVEDVSAGTSVTAALRGTVGNVSAETSVTAAAHGTVENVSAETRHATTTPIAARRADALERLADSYLAGAAQAVNGGDRCTVHIHTDISTLKADGDGAQAELAAGGCVSAETSRRLACDCGVVHWLETTDSQSRTSALDIGRRTRSIPPAIRRALERRDGGCRFPGCTARHHVDAHHIHHWADGGATRLNNLLLLCRHHHRLVHEGGYGLKLDAAGEPVFSTPNGTRLPPCPDTRFRGNVFALIQANRRERVEINARTLVPTWHGERMDDSMAVEGLVRRE